jgi:lysozyme family protein
MWYRYSQNATAKPPKNNSFIMPKGPNKPWYGNIIVDPSKYGQRFRDWVNSQLHPENERAGEGGLKNWPAAQGGLTNKGITQQEYDNFRKSQNKPVKSVANISNEEVDQILHRNYWARLNAEKLPPMVSQVIASYGLLRGAEEAASELQKIIKRSKPDQEITGNVYNKTLQNAHELSKTKQDEYKLAKALLQSLSSKLLSQKGMGGYKARMDNLQALIDQMYSGKKTQKEISSIQSEIEKEIQSLPVV